MSDETLNNSKPEHRILSEGDFGGLMDNSFALLMIEVQIAASRISEALESLRNLRNHIRASTDIKSRLYLLGRIEAEILLLES